MGLVTLMGGCALVDEPEGTATQLIAGDHGKVDQRAQYGLTGLGVARTLGELIGPINASQFSQLETDLSNMGITCTRANGCLTILNGSGSSTGPWPTDDPSQEKLLRADLFEMFVANPGISGIVIVTADDLTVAKGHTAFSTLDGQSIVGAHLAIDYSETATGVTSFETDVAASGKVYTARAGKFPGTSPEVVSVAATDYPAGGPDVVFSVGVVTCSTVFARKSYEPNLCAGGMRNATDISAVGHALPITFGGSVITIDSLGAPAAFILGRASLQTTAIATRADLFAGTASMHTDVTSGAGATVGFDEASGLGVPKGNRTK